MLSNISLYYRDLKVKKLDKACAYLQKHYAK